MGNFLRLYKFDLQFVEGKIAVTESLWPQIVSRLENGEKNIVLTLRIGYVLALNRQRIFRKANLLQ